MLTYTFTYIHIHTHTYIYTHISNTLENIIGKLWEKLDIQILRKNTDFTKNKSCVYTH